MKKLLMMFLILVLVTAGLFAAGDKEEQESGAPVEIKIFYPVEVAGPLVKVIDGLVGEFNASNPDIIVTAVYAGNYGQAMQKAQTAYMTGNPPDIAMLASPQVLMLTHMNAIVPLDKYIDGDNDYIDDFYPAFIDSVRKDGKIWGIPFQISTPLFYYNKDMFIEAGLDPDNPPTTWEEISEYAEKLTKKDASGNVTRYGLGFPDNSQWLMQTWALSNGGNLSSADGKEVYFDSEPVIGSLKEWVKLANKGVTTVHRTYGQLASDFVAGQVAMQYNSTGGLSFVKKSATFDFGAAFIPKNVRNAVPLGGGHMFMFAKTSEERRQASWKFMKWISEPERSAAWSIASGYMATRKSALEIPEMKEYTAGFPAALVALKQLEFSYPWWSVYEWDKIAKALETQMVRAVDGDVSPEEAMAIAQKESDKILEPYNK